VVAEPVEHKLYDPNAAEALGYGIDADDDD
jgi:hypothetical protein